MRHRYLIIGMVFTLTLSFTACTPVPDGVTMWIESPTPVELHEQFPIATHIKNESTTNVTLRSLDIGDTYLEGISIDRSDPPFSDSEHVPIDNTVAHSFEIDVTPGEHLVVIFYAEATRPGIHQGDFDICVNSLVNCDFQSITTRVEASP